MTPRVCIIGLDCADPRLVFEAFAAGMPAVTALRSGLRSGNDTPGPGGSIRDDPPGGRREGTNWGSLRSCHPPITVPAWSVMTSGRDPGQLGLYGFRNRPDYGYAPLAVATSRDVRAPRIWDRLDRPGDHSIVVGVPGTWPPTPIRGEMVSGPLAPALSESATYPPALAAEIEATVGEYEFDISGFRTLGREQLLEAIIRQTRRRFRLFRHLLTTRPWTFAMLVEMGTDRIHHAFWRYHDPAHRLHEPDSPWRDAIRDYYGLIDAEIAETLNALDSAVPRAERAALNLLIVSDHGARALEGGFALNDWLIREGYLALRSDLADSDLGGLAGSSDSDSDTETTRVPLQPDLIDWSRTHAWGEGGYYGRLFLNVAGREPAGIVKPAMVDALLAELTDKLESLPDDRGRPMGTHCHRPRDLYRSVTGVPPDLMIYFGDLAWRSIGTVDRRLLTGALAWRSIGTVDRSLLTGAPTPGTLRPDRITDEMLYTPGNDLGPDDANHDWEGIVIAAQGESIFGGSDSGQEGPEARVLSLPRNIEDVAGWVLTRLGVGADV